MTQLLQKTEKVSVFNTEEASKPQGLHQEGAAWTAVQGGYVLPI